MGRERLYVHLQGSRPVSIMFRRLPIFKSRKAKRSCVKLSPGVPHVIPMNSTLETEKNSEAAAQKPGFVFAFGNLEHPLKKKNDEISHPIALENKEYDNGPKLLFPIIVVLG